MSGNDADFLKLMILFDVALAVTCPAHKKT